MTQQTKFLIRILICIAVAAITLYTNINTINDLTLLRLAIPALEKELKALQRENERLQYEIDCFESPIHLMELSRKPEYGHLRYPRLDEVIDIKIDEGEK
ncbi:putative ftsL [Waddlia chondrophila 2032/99]|uniref:Putative ftsL n=1 Tax=Waddlia chondrophila 2032/99 TaxID=765953 RepID=F8LBR7_9BACT|nr:putative ftsL [Waddlia chondrophila 2032/99]